MLVIKGTSGSSHVGDLPGGRLHSAKRFLSVLVKGLAVGVATDFAKDIYGDGRVFVMCSSVLVLFVFCLLGYGSGQCGGGG